MAVTKVVEGSFSSDLAIVSSPEDAFGFKKDFKIPVYTISLQLGRKERARKAVFNLIGHHGTSVVCK